MVLYSTIWSTRRRRGMCWTCATSPKTPEVSQPIELPTPDQIPSFDDLGPPDFESTATEYDTEFVLEEESEALDSVLKDLGWEEEE